MAKSSVTAEHTEETGQRTKGSDRLANTCYQNFQKKTKMSKVFHANIFNEKEKS
jgi:hypothetical protein